MQAMRFGILGVIMIGLPVVAVSGWRPSGWCPPGTAASTNIRMEQGAARSADRKRATQLSAEGAVRTEGDSIVHDAWFTQLCHDLKGSGAVYLLLERVCGPDARFRFRCDLAVAGQTGRTRSFVRSARSARAAAERVWQDVVGYRRCEVRRPAHSALPAYGGAKKRATSGVKPSAPY